MEIEGTIAFPDDQVHTTYDPAHEVVRTAPNPDRTLLDFLQSTYEAAANNAGWDRAALERQSPTPAGDSSAT